MDTLQPADDGATRFSPITATDHAGVLWIAAILGLVYTSLALLARAWIKRKMYGPDDALVAAATAMHAGHAGALFVGLTHGLGKFATRMSTTEEEDPAAAAALAGRAVHAAQLLALLALGFAKCSVLALMLRVFTPEGGLTKGYRTCFAVLLLCIFWTVGAVVAVSIHCDGETLLTTQNEVFCPNQFVRWQIITFVDVATELLMCMLPIVLTYMLNMSTQMKVQVAFAFGFRMTLIPLSLLFLSFFSAYPSAGEPAFYIVGSLLFQQALLTASLITATVPNLKAFMKSFDMGFGLMAKASAAGPNAYALRTIGGSLGLGTGGSRGGGDGGGVALSTSATGRSRASTSATGRSRASTSAAAVAAARQRPLRPDGVQTETVVSASDTSGYDGSDLTRTGSQDLIITKEVEWRVRHDPL